MSLFCHKCSEIVDETDTNETPEYPCAHAGCGGEVTETPDERVVKIKMTNADDALYHHYQGQTDRQSVCLILDLENGVLCADWDAAIGSSTTHRAYHRVDLEWRIPPLRMKPLRRLMQSLRGECQQILDDSETDWDGRNHVGRLGDTAEGIYTDIDYRLESTTWEPGDSWEPWDAGDYYDPIRSQELRETGLSVDSTPEDIRDAAEREVAMADVALDVDDIERYLAQCVADAKEERDEEITVPLRDAIEKTLGIKTECVCTEAWEQVQHEWRNGNNIILAKEGDDDWWVDVIYDNSPEGALSHLNKEYRKEYEKDWPANDPDYICVMVTIDGKAVQLTGKPIIDDVVSIGIESGF